MRRRITGLVAIGAGVFLLVLAALLRFYAVPSLEKLPSDEWSRQLATGTGTALNPNTGDLVQGAQIVQDQTIKGKDPQPSGKPGSSVVWDVATETYYKTTASCGGTATADRCPLSFTQETVALGDHSGEALAWSGDTITPGKPDGTALHHSGYSWKFPFHLGKGDFMLFDAQTGKSYPAVFQGEDTLKASNGDTLKTYKFVSDVPPQEISKRTDVPPSLVGELGKIGTPVPMWYDKDTTTVWIDPISGLPIAGTQEVKIALHSLDGTQSQMPVLSGTLKLDQVQKTDDNDRPITNADGTPVWVGYTDQAIRDAKRVDKITLIRDTVPLYGGILGILLLLGGSYLIWRDSRPATPAPAGSASGPGPEPDEGETKTLPAVEEEKAAATREGD